MEAAELHQPDLVVLDLLTPELDGVEAARRIAERAPKTVIVMLTGRRDEEAALRGLRAGAVGCLSKDAELEALPRALFAALKGEAVISRRLAMRLVEHLRLAGTSGIRPVRSPLTSREWEVLDLLCEGRSNDEIADEFVLSAETRQVARHERSAQARRPLAPIGGCKGGDLPVDEPVVRRARIGAQRGVRAGGLRPAGPRKRA